MSEGEEQTGRVARFWQPVVDLWLADRRRFGLYVLLVAGMVLTVCLAVPLFGELFRAIDSKDDQADVRNIGIVLVGLFGGVFAVWRGLIAEKQTVVARQQFERSQDRDYADLFTKAVEQLGATREVREYDEEAEREVYRLEPNIEVRLGAIYALKRISQDSERDHIAVMEALCAYVRENAPATECKAFTETDTEENSISSARAKWVDALPPPKTHIQAALTAIGRRDKTRIKYEILNKVKLDLRFSNLRKCDFRSLSLDNVIASDSYFEGSDFGNADINLSNFENSKFEEVNFANSKIQKASFTRAILNGANFTGVDGQSVNFEEASISQANLDECNFQSANFSFCEIRNSNCVNTTFHSANLNNAKLEKSFFWHSEIDNASLFNSKMQESILWEVKFSPNNVHGLEAELANSSFCDFSKSLNVSTILLKSMFGCGGTKLPDNIDTSRPNHWYPDPLTSLDDRIDYHKKWMDAKKAGEKPPWVTEADWTGW